jgi:hypothetical protein
MSTWTQRFGKGRGDGNSDGPDWTEKCPADSHITKLITRSSHGLNKIGAVCSDGTTLQYVGGNGGTENSRECKQGFLPVSAASGWYIDGLTVQCVSDGQNYTWAHAGGNPQTCPTGYVISGYHGQSKKMVGMLAFECTPGTDDAKLKCCMSGGGKCRAFQPQSGTCDAFMRDWSKQNPSAPESGCLSSRLPVPNCTDSKCNAYAYHPSGLPLQCPLQSLTYQDCSQLLNIKDGSSNDVQANSFAQSCQQQYSDLRTVAPVTRQLDTDTSTPAPSVLSENSTGMTTGVKLLLFGIGCCALFSIVAGGILIVTMEDDGEMLS